MQDVFEILPYDLEEIGRSGWGNIKVNVNGFWSDPISLYIKRSWFEKTNEWEFSISCSSGGRDTKEVASDLEAYEYHSKAMAALVQLGRDLSVDISGLEASYQARRREDEEARAAEKAAKELAISADLALGMSRARDIIDHALVNVRNGGWSHIENIEVYERGAEKPAMLYIQRARVNITFYLGGVRMSKSEAIAKLAASSHRSAWVSNEPVAA